MTRPEFSIVLPVHNAGATLPSTIASVQAQSHRDWEMIIVDDGSVDNSLALALAAAAQDGRIRVVSRTKGGAASARNMGVDLAGGQLIAFLDADDIWAADTLARHAECHRGRPDLAASFARIAFLPQQSHDIAHCRTISAPPGDGLTLIDVLGENPVCTMSNLVVRRDRFQQLGGLDVRLTHAEDQALVAALLAGGARFAGIDAVLVGYRFSPDGLSMDFDAMRAGWRRVAQAHLDGAGLAEQEALYCRYLARRALRSAGPGLRALRHVRDGLRLDAGAFLAGRRRGLLTIAGALAAPLLPAPVRHHLFA